jgi:sulfite reductase alpha subunit-like flavoprotein
LWTLIDKKEAHFYICGDIQMVKSVRQVFKEIVTNHGKFTDAEAEMYIQRLQQNNRYAEDR